MCDFGYDPIQPKPWYSGLFSRTTPEADEFSTEKTGDVAATAFDKAKASANYGISDTIRYGLVTIGLTSEQGSDLDLYSKHTKLCAGIQKVQKVYQSYIAAEKLIGKAKDESENKGARLKAFAIGKDLLKNFDELIQLAIDQADAIGVDRAAYLEDLREVLGGNEGAHGHIYQTVNRLRAKAGLEEAFWVNGRDAFKSKYLRFVKDFATNVRDAHIQLGKTLSVTHTFTSQSTSAISFEVDEIYDHFFEGLASIPELGKLDDGLILIELYDALTPESEPDAPNEAILYFTTQIERLMCQIGDITTADLDGIQYQGISLQSVLQSKGVKQLHELKKLRGELNDLKKNIQKSEEKVAGTKQFIAQSFDYNFNDVQLFLADLSEGKIGNGANLEGLPKDGTVLEGLAASYTKAFKEHADLTREIQEATSAQEQVRAVRAQEITRNKEEHAKMQLEFSERSGLIAKALLDLEKKQKELVAFENKAAQIKENMTTVANGNKLVENVNEKVFIVFDAEMVPMREAIKQLQDQHEELLKAQEAQDRTLTELEVVIADLSKADRLQNEEDARILQDLNAQLEVVKAKKVAVLSGEDIQALATHLGINGQVASRSSLALQLNDVLKAEAEVKELTDNLLQWKKQAEETTSQISDRNATMFGDGEKAEIAAQLESNLVIAREVTLEVGRKIVKRQKDAEQALVQAVENIMPYELRENASVRKETDLQRELNIREGRRENVGDFGVLVRERIAKLAPVVAIPSLIGESTLPMARQDNVVTKLIFEEI